ncbi:MAG: non-canonical purine NTP pyrophosphatase [Patescibacteria group bacterium]
MRAKRLLLIATTNEGKYKEIIHFLGDLPFQFLSIKDLKNKIPEPEETERTVEGNALLKARYYAEQSGLVSLADDTGLFIDSLQGWPGVESARIAPTSEERNKLVLERLRGVAAHERTARFISVLAAHDPDSRASFFSTGATSGVILEKNSDDLGDGYGYDPLFYLPEYKKTYAQMLVREKNSCSHRGKSLFSMKYILANQYGAKHIVVPIALIIRDGKVLLALRNDPHRSAFHKKWEFPGGSMDMGETIVGNLVREVKEETGYDIEILTRLSYIGINEQQSVSNPYQVYLLPHVCTIRGGEEKLSDAEVLEIRWVSPDEVLSYELIGNNAVMYKEFLPELKQIIKERQL